MDSAPKTSLFSKSEKILLFTLAFIQFSHIVDFMILMPLGPQLMRIFEIAPHQFGLLVSAYTFAAGTTGIASAFFIDRYDRKKALLFFYVGFCLGTIACAFSPNYAWLLMARGMTGAFGGVLGSLILSILGDAIHPSKRGTAMGWVMASFSAASVLGVPFSLFLANQFNWHAPFMFLGILSTLLIYVIIKFIPSMTAHFHSQRENPFQLISRMTQNKNQMLALLFYALLVFGQFSVIPFLSPSLVANAGLLESQLPFIYLVGGAVTIFSSPFVGRMSDKFGKRRVLIIGTLISLLPLYLITNLKVAPLYVILALVAIFFASMGSRMIPATAIVTSTVTPRFRGSFMSITSSVQQFAAAIASYIAGMIVTRNLAGELVHYEVVGFVAVVFSVLAILASLKIKPAEGEGHI